MEGSFGTLISAHSVFVKFSWLPEYSEPDFLHLQSRNASEIEWDDRRKPLLGIHHTATLYAKNIAFVTTFLICEICELLSFIFIDLNKCTFLLYGDWIIKTIPISFLCILYYLISFPSVL